MTVRFSLVFPLVHERGVTHDGLLAWSRQTMSPERYEVIVAADHNTAIPHEFTAALRPQDRVIRGDFPELPHHFDAGIHAARGEYIFITESHCVPQPDCLEAMDRYLQDHPTLAGACTDSIPEYVSPFEEIDARFSIAGFRALAYTDDWRKLIVHGFALRRKVYFKLGGLRCHYGRFAEMLFSAAMRDAGIRLGCAREAAVRHRYRDTLQELIDGMDEYIQSEGRYRRANPGPDRIGHTYLPAIPDPSSPRARELNREVGLTLLSGACGRNGTATREGIRALWKAATASLGRRGPVAAAWLALAMTRLRCWRHRSDAGRLARAYHQLIWQARALSRIRQLAAYPEPDAPLPAPAEFLPIQRFPSWSLYGFHESETWLGENYRWTEGVAAMQFPLSPGRYRLRLATRGLRGECQPAIRAAFNGKSARADVLPGGDVELVIEPGQCRASVQTLVLTCDAIRPWEQGVEDYRELGLPIFGIEAVPVELERRQTSWRVMELIGALSCR